MNNTGERHWTSLFSFPRSRWGIIYLQQTVCIQHMSLQFPIKIRKQPSEMANVCSSDDSLSFSLHLDGSQLFERTRPGQKKRLTFTPPKQGGKCCAWGQIAFVLLPLYSLHHGLNGRLPWRCTEGLLLIGRAERVAADERSGKADAARADTSFSCFLPSPLSLCVGQRGSLSLPLPQPQLRFHTPL